MPVNQKTHLVIDVCAKFYKTQRREGLGRLHRRGDSELWLEG